MVGLGVDRRGRSCQCCVDPLRSFPLRCIPTRLVGIAPMQVGVGVGHISRVCPPGQHIRCPVVFPLDVDNFQGEPCQKLVPTGPPTHLDHPCGQSPL